MMALIQRVTTANVRISQQIVADIGPGVLAFIGVVPDDTDQRAEELVMRVLKYRIFGDDAGKMNLSLQQVAGDLLLVPQFTLAADTRHGLRPGFSTAAPPALGRRLFEVFAAAARLHHPKVSCGVFGADMQVSLTNDGPVTFWLQS
jgi:D-tyrosyl-tRNA(Tyr) deacylase